MGSVTVEIEHKRRAGALGFIYEIRGGFQAWWINCSICGCEYNLKMSKTKPPDELAASMRQKGWSIERKKPPICSRCVEEQKQMNAHAKFTPDPKLSRKVFSALDDHFDEDKKLYKPGWSDTRIATELNVSVMFVTDIRKNAYGELAEDPVLTVLRDDIELLKMEFTDKSIAFTQEFNRRLAELEAKLPKQVKKAIC